MRKQELRGLFLEKRTALSLAEAQEKSGDIAERFLRNFDLGSVSVLHTFIRIRKFNEVDTSMIYYKIWRDFPWVRTIAPRLHYTSGGMEHIEFDAEAEFIENRWGIREPVAGRTVAAREIDMVLVPGLCFDTRGHRVGYGKGFYDRFLSETRDDCVKIGLSYFDRVEKIDDAGDGDVRVDHCVTPDGVFTSPLECP